MCWPVIRSGGLYVQSFAAQFPDQVAGMVLLDATARKPGSALPTNTESYSLLGRVSAVLPAVAHLGAGRLLKPLLLLQPSAALSDEARANSSTARHLASWIEEFREGSRSMQQASSLTDLDGKPLIVLTADTGHDAKWHSAQDQMAKLPTNSLHRVAKATTHQSLTEDEADAATASQANSRRRRVRNAPPGRFPRDDAMDGVASIHTSDQRLRVFVRSRWRSWRRSGGPHHPLSRRPRQRRHVQGLPRSQTAHSKPTFR